MFPWCTSRRPGCHRLSESDTCTACKCGLAITRIGHSAYQAHTISVFISVIRRRCSLGRGANGSSWISAKRVTWKEIESSSTVVRLVQGKVWTQGWANCVFNAIYNLYLIILLVLAYWGWLQSSSSLCFELLFPILSKPSQMHNKEGNLASEELYMCSLKNNVHLL